MFNFPSPRPSRPTKPLETIEIDGPGGMVKVKASISPLVITDIVIDQKIAGDTDLLSTYLIDGVNQLLRQERERCLQDGLEKLRQVQDKYRVKKPSPLSPAELAEFAPDDFSFMDKAVSNLFPGIPLVMEYGPADPQPTQ